VIFPNILFKNQVSDNGEEKHVRRRKKERYHFTLHQLSTLKKEND
jgi:hypothetical protein